MVFISITQYDEYQPRVCNLGILQVLGHGTVMESNINHNEHHLAGKHTDYHAVLVEKVGFNYVEWS